MPKKIADSKKTPVTIRIKWSKGIKKGKYRLPPDIQFCYPDFRKLQKGKTLKEIRTIAENRKKKPNPFFYKPPKLKKGNT
jgi:hypothetical protein